MSESVSVDRQKRLGQFYTGVPLARLLAAFCRIRAESSVIDPMAGSGDLLVACAQLGVNQGNLCGVELDPVAYAKLRKRLPRAKLVNGNAFRAKSYSAFNRDGWDLVIANPPYVRYQSGSRASFEGLTIPSAVEVRRDLLGFLDSQQFRKGTEAGMFSLLAESYSGLSDLAVPSWILCASLVRDGGYLALIVPESWLNRNYASVINYMLLRLFTIECMITDDHAVWFSGAQVKTTLVIAKKTAIRPSGIAAPNYEYLKIGMRGGASRQGEPISMLGMDEVAFAKRVKEVGASGKSPFGELVEVTRGSSKTIADKIVTNAKAYPWLNRVEAGAVATFSPGFIPDVIKGWLAGRRAKGAFKPLSDCGAFVAQGLRTGANKFFYLSHQSSRGSAEVVKSELFKGCVFDVPRTFLAPVIRKQSDLSEDLYWQPLRASNGRVLVIKAPLDAARCTPASLALVDYIKRAKSFRYDEDGNAIPDLSAVRSNIRFSAKGDVLIRDWYMLPELAKRHFPDILLPRVVGHRVKAYALSGAKVVADANFITIRMGDDSLFPVAAVVAILNSSWARAVIENTAAVMGAGALKVEAAHLKNFPLPAFDKSAITSLERLGRTLDSSPSENLTEINRIVVASILGRRPNEADINELEEIATAAEKRRFSHKHYKHD